MNGITVVTHSEDVRGIRALNFLMRTHVRQMFDQRYETFVLTGENKARGGMLAIFTYPTDQGVWLLKGQLWVDATRIKEECVPAWVNTPLQASLMPGRESRDREARVQKALLELLRLYLCFDPDKQVVPWWDHDYRQDLYPSGVPKVSGQKLARILTWREKMNQALYPRNIWMLG